MAEHPAPKRVLPANPYEAPPAILEQVETHFPHSSSVTAPALITFAGQGPDAVLPARGGAQGALAAVAAALAVPEAALRSRLQHKLVPLDNTGKAERGRRRRAAKPAADKINRRSAGRPAASLHGADPTCVWAGASSIRVTGRVCRYALYEPLHALWRSYIADLIPEATRCLVLALVGCMAMC